MHKITTLLTWIALSGFVAAQTTIDLGRQTRNVDFSNSVSTKTFKTGTGLPSSCSQGDTYLKLDAPTGQNIYACTSNNVWTAQGGGADPSGTMAFEWARVNATEAQLSQGSFRFDAAVTNLTSPGTLTLNAATNGSVWIYASTNGSVVVGHNLGAGKLNVSGNGFVVDALSTGIPTGSLPLYICEVAGGAFPFSCTDLRATLSTTSFTAGNSGAISVDCQTGNNCLVDIVPGIVPVLGSANNFTGLNTFNQVRLPSGGTPDAQQCTTAEHAGKAWVNTSTASGRQLFLCEGASGWRAHGLVNISTASNIGFVSSVPAFLPLSAQTTVGSANQVRLVLTPISNHVRLARLAASVAATHVGGRARLGVYRTDGSLIAQTGDLDTSSAAIRDAVISATVLEPGFYYFAWAVDNTTARLAGAGTTSLNGLFNRVAASPAQATCSESMTGAGLPSMCTITAWPDNDSFPVIAIAGFAQ